MVMTVVFATLVTVAWNELCLTCDNMIQPYHTTFVVGAGTAEGCSELRKNIKEHASIVLPITRKAGMFDLKIKTSRCEPLME